MSVKLSIFIVMTNRNLYKTLFIKHIVTTKENCNFAVI